MKSIAESLQAWLNDWPGKPCPVTLDALNIASGDTYALTVQPLAETTVRTYITCARIIDYRFAVWLRVKALDDTQRANAFGIAESLIEWVKTSEPPFLAGARGPIQLKVDSAPVIAQRQAGSDDLQTVFILTYKQEANYGI